MTAKADNHLARVVVLTQDDMDDTLTELAQAWGKSKDEVLAMLNKAECTLVTVALLHKRGEESALRPESEYDVKP